jgi:hypothetical protein
MSLEDVGDVGGEEVSRLIERIAERSGLRLMGDFTRPERFSVSVSRPLLERLDLLASILGKSRSETAAWVMLLGVTALEEELVKTWKEFHEG